MCMIEGRYWADGSDLGLCVLTGLLTGWLLAGPFTQSILTLYGYEEAARIWLL